MLFRVLAFSTAEEFANATDSVVCMGVSEKNLILLCGDPPQARWQINPEKVLYFDNVMKEKVANVIDNPGAWELLQQFAALKDGS